jgi:hypothetical protein
MLGVVTASVQKHRHGAAVQSHGSNRAITLQDLQPDMNKGVSVRFVPERRGDGARDHSTQRLNAGKA